MKYAILAVLVMTGTAHGELLAEITMSTGMNNERGFNGLLEEMSLFMSVEDDNGPEFSTYALWPPACRWR